MVEQTETELRLLRDRAVATNNWYSPDRKYCAIVGADGRLILMINGAHVYLYPFEGEGQ